MIETKQFIDPTARIHPTAKIAADVVIGPWVCIGEYVEIGSGTRIEAHAVVKQHTIMGKNNHIHSHAVVGGDPQDLSYRGETTWLKMGDGNIVREFVTINRGSAKSGTTLLGNKNCFLSYSHVAHDAHIGNEVLFVNNASIAGHVTIDDFAIVGAYAAVHQFTQIGSYSFLVHATQVSHDIPPFMLVKGTPGVPFALNLVALRRRGFSPETISGLKKAYRLMYRQRMSMKELELALAELAKTTPEVQLIIDLMKNSKRGIVRKLASKPSATDSEM
ncbi:MAG: acyl-[acyl-carrier-protein]--UDP-N-acetylglucosamine O-acyltransferase [Gammaproteobacteria bacterium CG_4_10_14_0_8_um_filter_38_16]|nr:MAG: acyl-[acyl-carrier-protein]--UDP-N-acetylglucosamine O-acyltransferase [Gammaproteobacteria bacterium CG_4_10_14_0_8_um_filter_38_16]PJA02676.1 MAG: acyl-[acyl-carrier-protein]--UDP-N-acetylglucosamine O-acyltransferase [Gammaproteobacteria bacterium CG_4_10_14_0_2_um_filter_38_22]PJB09878.1 MAG: acyl-[acyl-carrier-protein]--UDP-N-acetylglucosamine O-acyltransferase [Gammaproteobacteria bacterium CG_4_9_14_3_um_filter_38_9]